MKRLYKLNDKDLTQVGGKIAMLHHLETYYPTPLGFCVFPNDDPAEIQKFFMEEWEVSCITRWAVRSSGIAEDSVEASFAGQYLTLLNVEKQNIAEAIVTCRKSEAGAQAYAHATGVESRGMCVLIQKMVVPDYAGIYLEIDVTSNDVTLDRFEYVRGLGDGLANGSVQPLASVSRATPNDMYQRFMKFINRYSSALPHPMDIEWAIANGDFVLLQARPISQRVLRNMWKKDNNGIGSGTGIVTGTVQRWPSPDKDFIPGNILVTRMTEPSMVREMLAASGIITEIGGRTCHAAIVARELGKPCVVGIPEAILLTDGDIVTVDANAGTILRHEQIKNSVQECAYAMVS